MSAKAVKKIPAKVKVAKAKPPSVLWMLLARSAISDRTKGTISAIEIVEDWYLPASAFSTGDKLNVVEIDQALSLIFTLDWKWPEEASDDSVRIKLDWYAPSGMGYFSDSDEEPLLKPAKGSRTHVDMKLSSFPIEEEGIYHLELILNGVCAARYPLRIRALPEVSATVASVPRKKRSKQSNRATKIADGIA